MNDAAHPEFFRDALTVAEGEWTPTPLVPERIEVSELSPRAAAWLKDSCPIEVSL